MVPIDVQRMWDKDRATQLHEEEGFKPDQAQKNPWISGDKPPVWVRKPPGAFLV
jgi:hypothetical protein